jgi:hypothetical protein
MAHGVSLRDWSYPETYRLCGEVSLVAAEALLYRALSRLTHHDDIPVGLTFHTRAMCDWHAPWYNTCSALGFTRSHDATTSSHVVGGSQWCAAGADRS